jgi:hypothetical protein
MFYAERVMGSRGVGWDRIPQGKDSDVKNHAQSLTSLAFRELAWLLTRL